MQAFAKNHMNGQDKLILNWKSLEFVSAEIYTR